MDDRIRFYFDQGLTQTEIALCLSVIDDLHISVRHLRRRLSGLQLYRRRQYSDPERVVNFIASQLRHMNSQIMENVIQYYCMSMTAHCVFIAKRNLNIELQTIFTAVR